MRQDQDKWWVHTEGEKTCRGYQANRRSLLDLLEGGKYLRFNENGACENDNRVQGNIVMFHETLTHQEITEGLRLMEPIIKSKHPRDTSNDTEMDKYRQTFSLNEENLTSAGENQVVVDAADDLLGFIKAAAAQDTGGLFAARDRRHFMATVSVSSTHETDLVGYGTARLEITFRGSAWYIFKPPDQPALGQSRARPACIVEVKAGSSIMILGECHNWEYLVLRSDLLRPGPTELVNTHAVQRVIASVIYGDVQPIVAEDKFTALPPEVATPRHRASRRHAKTKSEETNVPSVGGDNWWMADQADGKAIGSFQPTTCIQARAPNSRKIFPDHIFEYSDTSGAWRQVQIVRVGQWHTKDSSTQRVIVARTRLLEITSEGLRPEGAWDPMRVVSANQVQTFYNTHTHTHTHTQ